MGGVRCLGKSPKKRFYIWFVKRIFARNSTLNLEVQYNTMSNHSPTERKPFVWFFLIFLSVISVKYLQVTKLRCYCYKWERRILSCFDGLVLNPPSSLGILLCSIKNVVCIFYLVLYLWFAASAGDQIVFSSNNIEQWLAMTRGKCFNTQSYSTSPSSKGWFLSFPMFSICKKKLRPVSSKQSGSFHHHLIMGDVKNPVSEKNC